MKHNFYNKIGQIVGEYDTVSKTYHTVRDKRKGEIFVKKNWFSGAFIRMPIAIDKAILDRLIKFKCQTIQILVIGVLNRSYMVSVTPEYVKENGVEINYDKVKQGRNITHFGNQIVFGISDKKLDSKQKQLVP